MPLTLHPFIESPLLRCITLRFLSLRNKREWREVNAKQLKEFPYQKPDDHNPDIEPQPEAQKALNLHSRPIRQSQESKWIPYVFPRSSGQVEVADLQSGSAYRIEIQRGLLGYLGELGDRCRDAGGCEGVEDVLKTRTR